MTYSEHDVNKLVDAARIAENWLTEFGADDGPDEGLRLVVQDLRTVLQPFGFDLRPAPRCEVAGCNEVAEWEGWWRALDPFLGIPTGLVQRRNVCDEHKDLLIGEEG